MRLDKDHILGIKLAAEKRKNLKNKSSIILMFAAKEEVTTIEDIKKIYPKMSDKEVKTLLRRIKLRRKELVIASGHTDVAGIHNKVDVGYVYLIENECFPGWIKCGMTTNLESRLKSYNAYDPDSRFRFLLTKEVDDRKRKERLLIYNMKSKAIRISGKEWFRIDSKVAEEIFSEI